MTVHVNMNFIMTWDPNFLIKFIATSTTFDPTKLGMINTSRIYIIDFYSYPLQVNNSYRRDEIAKDKIN